MGLAEVVRGARTVPQVALRAPAVHMDNHALPKHPGQTCQFRFTGVSCTSPVGTYMYICIYILA